MKYEETRRVDPTETENPNKNDNEEVRATRCVICQKG